MFGCETRSLWNTLVLSVHQIFNPDMSCSGYSGAHKPFIRIGVKCLALFVSPIFLKTLGAYLVFPEKVTRLFFRGPGLVELMALSRGYFCDFPEMRTTLLCRSHPSLPPLLPKCFPWHNLDITPSWGGLHRALQFSNDSSETSPPSLILCILFKWNASLYSLGLIPSPLPSFPFFFSVYWT